MLGLCAVRWVSESSAIAWNLDKVMALYAVFGVGIGNLGRQRIPRRPMANWVKDLNILLRQGTPSVRILV
jgi:hypothetical protein